MKKLNLFALLFAITFLSSCELVGDIFAAGAYTAVFVIVIVIALVIWLISRFRGRS